MHGVTVLRYVHVVQDCFIYLTSQFAIFLFCFCQKLSVSEGHSRFEGVDAGPVSCGPYDTYVLKIKKFIVRENSKIGIIIVFDQT